MIKRMNVQTDDDFVFNDGVKIHKSARINCNYLEIGKGSVINKDCVIEGNSVVIGREFWMDEGSVIGGGSCFDLSAYLVAGDFLHMGRNSQVNIARGVEIGSEVGIGIQTQIFTHGGYLSEAQGFPVSFKPVKIGSNVWLPNAIVTAGVNIGDNVVVTTNSTVTRDVAAGSLAGGCPTKVITKDAYPNLNPENVENILQNIVREFIYITSDYSSLNFKVKSSTVTVMVYEKQSVFDISDSSIRGSVSVLSELFKNQLRRHGIRFRYEATPSGYLKWFDVPTGRLDD